MRLGILALVLIFFASGAKNIREAGIGKRRDGAQSSPASDADTEQAIYDRRKLAFGGLMLLVGMLVLIYYFATI